MPAPGWRTWSSAPISALAARWGTDCEIHLAATFAWALRVALALAPVAEPLPPGLDDHLPRRLFGPAVDPVRYVEDLVVEWRPLVPEVEGAGFYDPLGPSQGLRHHLQAAPAGMLVVSARAREGWSRFFHGSVGVDLVRASRCRSS